MTLTLDRRSTSIASRPASPPLTTRDDGTIDDPQTPEAWDAWVSAGRTRNYLKGDPLLDWLHRYGEAQPASCPTTSSTGYDPRTDFLAFIFEQGKRFEDARHARSSAQRFAGHPHRRRAGGLAGASPAPIATFEAMRAGAPSHRPGGPAQPREPHLRRRRPARPLGRPRTSSCPGTLTPLRRACPRPALGGRALALPRRRHQVPHALDSTPSDGHGRVDELSVHGPGLGLQRGPRAPPGLHAAGGLPPRPQLDLRLEPRQRLPRAPRPGRPRRHRRHADRRHAGDADDRRARLGPAPAPRRRRVAGAARAVGAGALPARPQHERRSLARRQAPHRGRARRADAAAGHEPGAPPRGPRPGHPTLGRPAAPAPPRSAIPDKWADQYDAVLAVNRPGAPVVLPERITGVPTTWRTPAPLELYVDFETVSNLADDFSALPAVGGQPLIFQIGCGRWEAGRVALRAVDRRPPDRGGRGDRHPRLRRARRRPAARPAASAGRTSASSTGGRTRPRPRDRLQLGPGTPRRPRLAEPALVRLPDRGRAAGAR